MAGSRTEDGGWRPSTTSLPVEQIRSALQPIVDLGSMAVVGYEALARGPEGPLSTPNALFAAARERRGAGRAGPGLPPCGAESGDRARGLETVVALREHRAGGAGQRAVGRAGRPRRRGTRWPAGRTRDHRAGAGQRPAELLRTVERVRSRGWRIALDDVGADDMSLAFMPLLRPEVVKLDLRLVRDRPSPEVASIMNAVTAYSEATRRTRAGRGHRERGSAGDGSGPSALCSVRAGCLGRPAFGTVAGPPGEMALPLEPAQDWSGMSPFGCLPNGTRLRRSTKPLLTQISEHLERESIRYGPACVHRLDVPGRAVLLAGTAARYAELVKRVGFVAVLGEGLEAEPVARDCVVPSCRRMTRCGASGTSSCWPRTSRGRCWRATSATARSRQRAALRLRRDVRPRHRRQDRAGTALARGATKTVRTVGPSRRVPATEPATARASVGSLGSGDVPPPPAELPLELRHGDDLRRRTALEGQRGPGPGHAP